MRFFLKSHKEVSEQSDGCGIYAERQRVKPTGFSQHNKEETCEHRVLDMSIRARHNHTFRWITGERRPVSSPDEIIGTGEEEGSSSEAEQYAAHSEEQTKRGFPRLAQSKEIPGDESKKNTWQANAVGKGENTRRHVIET